MFIRDRSMSVKMEIIMEFLRWPNARFILVDPENEYELLVKALGGEAIKVSVEDVYKRQGLFPAKTTERKRDAIKSPRKMLPSISTAESPTRCTTLRPADGITTTPSTRSLPHRWSGS